MDKKRFRGSISFQSIDIDVTAKNKREAMRKVKEKLAKKSLLKLVDYNNSGVDEI